VKFIIDNCISPRYAAVLSALGVDAVALRDEMPANTKDIDVFPKFKGRSIVFVTCDTSQRTRYAEAKALRDCGATALFLGPFWPKMTFWQQAAWLVSRWERIEAFAGAVKRGTAADIKHNGKPTIFQL
jgi:hypothetical protein